MASASASASATATAASRKPFRLSVSSRRTPTRRVSRRGFRWPARPSSQGHWSPSPCARHAAVRYDAARRRGGGAGGGARRLGCASRRRRAGCGGSRSRARGASSRNAALRRPSRSLKSPSEGVMRRGEPRIRADERRDRSSADGARRAVRAFSPSRVVAIGARARVKRTITRVFHPVYPFAMSVSQAFMQPQVVSFHLRWDGAAGAGGGADGGPKYEGSYVVRYLCSL